MKINQKIKAVLFDLDDTLLDTTTAEYRAICKFKNCFQEFNTINKEEFAKLWHKITEELTDRYHNGEFSFEELRENRMKSLFSSFNIKISDEEAKENFNKYMNLYEKEWILFDDATKLLEELKGKYKLAIVTNGNSANQRRKIEKTGLGKYFQEIIVSSEVGCAKPNRQIFEIACNKLNVNSEECMMIGDKFKIDVEGSRNYGMTSVWVNRKNENINYEYEIKELNELGRYKQFEKIS